MSLNSWLRCLKTLSGNLMARNTRPVRGRVASRRKPARARLSLEALEDRTVLSAFTLASPTGAPLPSGVTEVGGVVLDLVGSNGVRVVSQLSASTLFDGYFDSGTPASYQGNPGTIGIQTGFNSAVINALGGGLSKVAVRITLFDGDTAAGNFDYNLNSLLLNGISIGNFSNVVTQQTTNDGLTVLSNNPSGGFRDNTLDTGFFYSNNSGFLSSFYTSLVNTGQVKFQVQDVSPYDNLYDFTAGVSGGLVNVGQAPNVSPVISSVTNNGPIGEGGTATISVVAYDPDNTAGGLTYEFDLDGNGSFELSNTTGIAQRTFGGPGTYAVNVRVSDTRGGIATGSTSVVVQDTTPPSVSTPDLAASSDSGASNADNVTNASVLVFNGTAEAGSTVKLWEGSSLLGTMTASAGGAYTFSVSGLTQGSHAIYATATDAAGNTATTGNLTVLIDRTPPTIIAGRDLGYEANSYGWNNGLVSVGYTASDALSGLLAGTETGGVVFPFEGEAQSATFTVTDRAGNSASTTVSNINIDLTPPILSASATTADNNPYPPGVWTNQDVTVHYTANDALSRIVSTPADQIFSEG